jgi:hypothetical protein
VALTNAAGRVIAATAPSVVPGQRVDVSHAVPAPVRSWRLVDL